MVLPRPLFLHRPGPSAKRRSAGPTGGRSITAADPHPMRRIPVRSVAPPVSGHTYARVPDERRVALGVAAQQRRRLRARAAAGDEARFP